MSLLVKVFFVKMLISEIIVDIDERLTEFQNRLKCDGSTISHPEDSDYIPNI